jgi:hypothetical protein
MGYMDACLCKNKKKNKNKLKTKNKIKNKLKIKNKKISLKLILY